MEAGECQCFHSLLEIILLTQLLQAKKNTLATLVETTVTSSPNLPEYHP